MKRTNNLPTVSVRLTLYFLFWVNRKILTLYFDPTILRNQSQQWQQQRYREEAAELYEAAAAVRSRKKEKRGRTAAVAAMQDHYATGWGQRRSLRPMPELASIVNLLYAPLNIKVKLSAEEFETALIAPKKHFGRYTHTSTEGWALSFAAIDRRKQTSPEPSDRREIAAKPVFPINGGWIGPSQIPQQDPFDAPSPKSSDYDVDHKPEPLDRRSFSDKILELDFQPDLLLER
ncbi:hypothetical protein RHMOL_Rhmol08G0224600 [Rhododendron molle]|uniref:Uncharacterized protein n=1 Tax=Rhododendron molle TaxID=49168 RepID=A0ACC0MSH6_RHOML|nr:hypothetical protein RHMOL_Rhmol08G0224600 [Rhododendron molle]